MLAACCAVAVSLSRHCVTVVEVGIKCSFPLISSVASDVAIGTSSVAKQTLLFSSSPSYFFCLPFCVFYLSVCFPHVGEDFYFCGCLALPQTGSSQTREKPDCPLLGVVFRHCCLQHSVVQQHGWCQLHCHLLLWESLRDSYV